MITSKQLCAGENKYWTERPPSGFTSLEILSWYAAKELACILELHMEDVGYLHRDWPETWSLLMGIEHYLITRGALPSQPHALVLHINERVEHGLTAYGDDTEPS